MATPTFTSPVRHVPDGDNFEAHKRRSSLNWGQDFKVAVGTPVYAPGNGTIAVDDDGPSGGAGISIVIYHDTGDQAGWSSDLLHLSRNVVKRGQWVREGDLIGYSGNTGASTGPHLHWSLRNRHSTAYNSVGNVDPKPHIKSTTTGGSVPIITAAFALAQLGAANIKSLQAQLHVPETGKWDNPTEVALQKKIGTLADGLFGNNSNKALQKFLAIPQDGLWGPATTAAFKKAIAASKFGTPVTTPPVYVPPTQAEYTALVARATAAEAKLASANTALASATNRAIAAEGKIKAGNSAVSALAAQAITIAKSLV